MHALREEGDLKVLWGDNFFFKICYSTQCRGQEVNFEFLVIACKVAKPNLNLDLFQYQTQELTFLFLSKVACWFD